LNTYIASTPESANCLARYILALLCQVFAVRKRTLSSFRTAKRLSLALSVSFHFGASIYFPDHLEPENADDDMLMCWDYFAGELKKSLRLVQRARQEYGSTQIEESVIEELERYLRLDKLDELIAMLREARMSAERRVWQAAERAKT
jgi:hypothetical protein